LQKIGYVLLYTYSPKGRFNLPLTMNILSFIKSVRAELVYVKWPTKKMVAYSTLAVIVISTIVALYLGGVDILLKKLISLLLVK
jgi:preprotein translocase SecE subunit